jgi:integral membrane protein
MRGPLLRFRVMAWIVGVFLLVLCFVAVPLQIFANNDTPVKIVGQIHGFLYIVYLVVAFDLAVRARWSIQRTILVLLAGTVPIMSFVAERKVTGWMRDRQETPVPARM